MNRYQQQSTPGHSDFLRLPLEVRVMIYRYAISDSSVYTLGGVRSFSKSSLEADPQQAAEPIEQYSAMTPITSFKSAPQPSKELRGVRTFPLLAHGRCDATLKEQTPLVIPESALLETRGRMSCRTAAQSLPLVCRQINTELDAHSRCIHLPCEIWVSFPNGLNALIEQCADLLRRATKIHIVGSYNAFDWNAASSRFRARCSPHNTAHEHLVRLAEAVFHPSKPTLTNISVLNVRIACNDVNTPLLGDRALWKYMIYGMRQFEGLDAVVDAEQWKSLADKGKFEGCDVLITKNERPNSAQPLCTTYRRYDFLNGGGTDATSADEWLFDPETTRDEDGKGTISRWSRDTREWHWYETADGSWSAWYLTSGPFSEGWSV